MTDPNRVIPPPEYPKEQVPESRSPDKPYPNRCYRVVETISGCRPVQPGVSPEAAWYSRGYLPHWDSPGATQFITFRLHDSFPTKLRHAWEDQLSRENRRVANLELMRRLEDWLDKGTGCRWLADPRVARIVEESLLYWDGRRYRLHAWVVMPNHAHILISVFAGVYLAKLFHSWRSFTAHEANKVLGREGTFWAREPFDRYIRSREHFEYELAYIEENPVKAGLCATPETWRFGSARRRAEDGGIIK